jgi:hypothetical protein
VLVDDAGPPDDRWARSARLAAVPALALAGRAQALDERLLAADGDALGVPPGGPAPGEPDLLDDPQAGLDHDHLLVDRDDRGVALLPGRDGGVDQRPPPSTGTRSTETSSTS